jgi:hypothetical protein
MHKQPKRAILQYCVGYKFILLGESSDITLLKMQSLKAIARELFCDYKDFENFSTLQENLNIAWVFNAAVLEKMIETCREECRQISNYVATGRIIQGCRALAENFKIRSRLLFQE